MGSDSEVVMREQGTGNREQGTEGFHESFRLAIFVRMGYGWCVTFS
jgi:hypothetical protein